METAELGKKLTEINRRIQGNTESVAEMTKRQEGISKKLEENQTQLEDARKERQQFLVVGKDTTKISGLIRKTEEEMELVKDEAAGLEERLRSLAAEEKDLHEEKRKIEGDIQEAHLISLVKAYNKTAAELAKIVAEMWAVRDQMGDHYHTIVKAAANYSSDGIEEGSALTRIPKLFLLDALPVDSQEWLFYREEAYRKAERDLVGSR